MPVTDVTIEEAVGIARDFGAYLGALGVSVLLL